MADNWEALESACMRCRACALADTRTHVVFGVGNRNAEVLLVGEGPGQNEDEQGVPFVGRAGALLDDMLEIIGLDRTKVYIANIVKCRPPNNRDPPAEHGQWFQRNGVQMTAIYHPSALLRDVSKRPETFQDLKSIQAKIRELCPHTEI